MFFAQNIIKFYRSALDIWVNGYFLKKLTKLRISCFSMVLKSMGGIKLQKIFNFTKGNSTWFE